MHTYWHEANFSLGQILEDNVNSSLYIGATGMKGLSQGMNVTTNNLANVSTIAYKKQEIHFSDVIYQTQGSLGEGWQAQEGSRVAIGQVGQGLQVEDIRTRYTEGNLESTNRYTDLAIAGKGFFQVTDGTNTFYTRAGDFITDAQGVWRTPGGLALNGYRLDEKGNRSELAAVQVDPSETLGPSATTQIELSLNLKKGPDRTSDPSSPFFSLLSAYNASSSTPLSQNMYNTAQSMTLYDAEGNPTTVTAYFDEAPAVNGDRMVEFVIAGQPEIKVDENGVILPVEEGSGLLMSGVLRFDQSGNLLDVSAFAPSEAGNKDLSTWKPASMAGGSPELVLDGTPVAINFGLTGRGGWTDAPESAAAIGSNGALLPSLGDGAIASEFPTTGFNTSALVNSYKQNGYREGVLSNLAVTAGGRVTGYYSNGESRELWEIPVCRFTSEDGLRREGGNLFTATVDSGEMEMGQAGTENYGDIRSYNIEASNVDMAQEMVSMIVTQRGFQSNSKVVTTADEMLRRALELKR